MAASAKDIQLRELKDMLSQLNTTIETQTELIKSLRMIIDAKTENEKVLQEQIDYLTKKLFGTSSEKRSIDIPGQYNLFNEAEQEDASYHEDEETEVTVIKEYTRKKKSNYAEQFKGIPTEKIVIPLPEDQKICPECGTQMEYIGETLARRELKFVPASCTLIEYYVESYGCPSCKQAMNDAEHAVIVKSKATEGLVGKGPASSSSVAWSMYQKYANSIPLYRQEKDWEQYGAAISRTTLAHWIIYCTKHYFKPLYDFLHRELIKRSFVMADETRIQVLKEEGRAAETDSFMWLFRSGDDGKEPIILYHYTPTRAGDNAAEFLEGFSGYLMTDGYQGYNKVPGIIRLSCWAHIRRYFIDAVPKGKAFDYSQPAVQGVQYCDRLFKIDKEIHEKYPHNYDMIKKLRLEKEKPILEAFWSWFDGLHPVRNSRLYKAVVYVNNRRETSMNYLEDGRCSLSNNWSENSIRPFTVGRKNWLFSDSTDGAEASAIAYTMVEMAKAHGLNIYKYLEFLLDQRPDASWSDDQLAEIVPWGEKVQHLRIECEAQ